MSQIGLYAKGVEFEVVVLVVVVVEDSKRGNGIDGGINMRADEFISPPSKSISTLLLLSSTSSFLTSTST